MIINMKRGTIIGIAFIVYIVAMVGMFLGVDAYVKSKDKRLRNEMHNKIDALFEDRRQYVDFSLDVKNSNASFTALSTLGK